MKNEVDEFEWDDPRAFEFVFEPKVETDTPLKGLLTSKLPVKKKKKKQTPEHIEKRMSKMRIISQSREYKEKMRKSLSGKNNPRYGIKLSDELKKRISESEKGKKVIITEETKRKISEAHKGRIITWGNKISESRKGMKLTEQHKENISKGLKIAIKEGRKKLKKGRTEQGILLRKVRNLYKYEVWRDEILKRDVTTYPKIPKNTQVHHIIPLLKLIQKNNIKTSDEANGCVELWDIDNGIAITKGEHFCITKMEWYCKNKVSIGFIEFLKCFIEENKENAIRL